MNPIIRNILAVVSGLIFGSLINMGIIMISGSLIPPPEGADTTTMEGLKASMHLFEPKHFLMPFLAHALGTLTGAWLAVKFATGKKMPKAYIVAGFFMVGGISNVLMLPSPMWYSLTDILLAYLPMGYLGGKWASSNKQD